MTSPKVLVYHEAGHVVSWLHYGQKIEFVTIDPIKCKETVSNKNEACDGWLHILEGYTATPFEEAVHLISGCVAEAKSRNCHLTRCIEQGGNEDFEKAECSLDYYYKHLTENLENFSHEGGEPRFILTSLAINESRYIINKNWESVEKVALALLKRKTLTHDDVVELINNG